MGLFDLNNPGRAGFEAAKYDGWAMANIIRDFVYTPELDLSIERNRVILRRAMLVSKEYNMVSNGVRFNV